MKRFLALVAAIAAGVAAAAFLVPADAASVNGTTISQQSLDADLSAISSSTGYQCYLAAGLELNGESPAGLFPVTGAGAGAGSSSATGSGGGSGPGTYNNTFVRYWLTEMLSNDLLGQQLARDHLTLTPADLAVGTLSLEAQITGVLSAFESQSGSSCGVTGTALYSSLPASFRSQQDRAQAERDLLAAHEAGYSLTTASLESYFSAHRPEFATECISYVGFSSQSAANAARAKIEAGTPIATTGTLTPIGCGIEHSITSLPTSVTHLAVGAVSTPLSAGTGAYALLEVTKRTPSSFPTAKTAVESAVLAAGSPKADAIITRDGRRARVTADPQYGKVKIGTVAIGAPTSPSGRFVLNPTADLPEASAVASPSPSSPSGAKTSSSSKTPSG